jgi:hypothetical protein
VTKRRETPQHEQSLRILNSISGPLVLLLEPWAERYVVAPGAAVELEARGPEGGCLEVSIEPDSVIVYGWTGSTVDVTQEGEMLTPDLPRRTASK